MKNFKRVDGDYEIELLNNTDVFTIDSNTIDLLGNVEVAGNLVVNGNATITGNLSYIETDQLQVKDPFIELNTSNTATYSSNSGILTHKTSSTYAGFRYNTTTSEWELSSDTNTTGTSGTWYPLAYGNLANVAGSNQMVQFNSSGQFGASTKFLWIGGSDQLYLDGTIVLQNVDSTPGAVGSASLVYSDTASTGDTGLYVASSTGNNELISKNKAVVFAMIF